jgi:hypothetical protein
MARPIRAADIDHYFQRYGWIARKTDDDHWQTTFTGDLATFTIDVSLSDQWLHCAIDLSSYGWSDKPEQARRLLAANADMLMAKFAIDPHSKLLLKLEMPLEGFGYSHFADCLGALSHYADIFCREWYSAAQLKNGSA